MKTILRNLFLLSALLWGLHSQAVVRTDSLYSTVMDEWVKYNVYTPDSFDDSGLTAYPVLYLLHGLSDYYGAWNNNA
ncbi:MAG: alpha/beta hydrolase-fold protein, partial [Bacteroidales bacterium]|nr:alpha/beta hydrolase-fold protein [Bacteroidales bacterium]